MVLGSLSKEEAATSKHLTIQACQLTTDFIPSLILSAYVIETEGKPHHPCNGEMGEEARVTGSIREGSYPTAGDGDIARSKTHSTVIRNLTEKASLLT